MTLQEFIYNTSINPKYTVGLVVEIPDRDPYVHKFEIRDLLLEEIYDEYFRPDSIIEHIYFYDNCYILINLINKGEN